ncbi:MAG: helix-turn-helix transcriptional regulator [Candidatus Acidiferrum sp.]
MLPGLRLRQARERLGLTYRDVERASFELAARRGRPELILHISRLADIENRGVAPGLYKLYTLAVVYHLNPLEIFRWYDVPIEDCFPDGGAFHAPHTHLAAPPVALKTPLRFDPAFDPKRTELLSRMVEQWGSLEGVLTNGNSRHHYGYIGLADRRMVPLLRPGSVVLVDVSARRIEDDHWANEYERPMYFVEVHDGCRCGWFHQDGARLLMQPHPLSHCMPEAWRLPEEAEVVGRVVGVVTRLNEPWNILAGESQAMRGDSSRKAP